MSRISRRGALQTLSALVGAAALPGCAPDESSSPSPTTEDGEDNELIGCFRKQPTRTGTVPHFDRYEKVVVLMMENRSFDHYFGHLSIPKSLGGEGRTDVNGLTGTESNPGPNGERVKVYKTDDYAIGDVTHEWDPCRRQFSNGKLDGFVLAQHEDLAGIRYCGMPVDPAAAPNSGECAKPHEAMAYYGRNDTPAYHQLADEFVLCDRWFGSVLGPTWPNRFYMQCAQAYGVKASGIREARPGPSTRTIFEALKDKCVEPVNFFADVPFSILPMGRVRNMAPLFENQRRPYLKGGSAAAYPIIEASLLKKSFEERCRDGSLPPFSLLDPKFLGASADDHAPADIRLGQAFVAAVYNMLRSNEEQWQKTLFIITYDEHGGFYDHVKPPTYAPDGPEFGQMGFRVPAIIVGPYVKRGAVVHTEYDHVSVLSTLTRRFDLTPLNARVKDTSDLRDCIDLDAFESAPRSPPSLAPVSLSHSAAFESIVRAHGQADLAKGLGIPQMTPDEKARDLDTLLTQLDRHGAVRVGR